MVQSNDADDRRPKPKLSVWFFRTPDGSEPVKRWLRDRSTDDRRAIGAAIKTVQYGWPLGMPLVRKLQPGLWEVRSIITDGVARIVFTVEERTMVLPHGFVKKAQAMPHHELDVARRRRARLRSEE